MGFFPSSGSFPLPIATVIPFSVANFAALIFVAIPPVPLLVPGFPAIFFISSVTSLTTVIFLAFGSVFGSLSYKASMSVSRIKISAFIKSATIAERLSLSPNFISSTSTESFSFTTGIHPILKSASKVFVTFFIFSASVITSLVKRICPI